QVLHGHLREGWPREVRIGPFNLLRHDVAGREGSAFPDGFQHARPHGGAYLREVPDVSRMRLAIPEAPKVVLPVRIEIDRQDGGAMGPVLENSPVDFEGVLKVGRAVAVVSREQDVMMRS